MTHPYLVLSNAHTYARTLPLTAACEQAVTRTSCTDREGLTRRLAQRHANKRASETHAQLYTRSLAHPHARARGRELAFVHAHTRQAHANLGLQKAYTCFFFFFYLICSCTSTCSDIADRTLHYHVLCHRKL